MTARTPVYNDSGKLHAFESGDTLPSWLMPPTPWASLTGVPTGIAQLASLTGPGYAKLDSAGSWSVQAAIPQADVSGLTTALAGLQPISARLTSIAGLTDAAGWLHDDGSGSWALTTPTKSDVGLSLVENTALSTWGGSANLTTLGTIATGAWNGTAIADAYISSAAAWNAKEGGLGNPTIAGQVLASTISGTRFWISLPNPSTTTPAALGTAAVGTGVTWARADHVHAMPTASQVGAEPALGAPSTSGYLLSSTSAGARSWVAPYSLPTATASVLGGVMVGTGLSISSGALSVSYGTATGTACVGNDSRLSDSRTPTAHALDGALHTISGKTAGQSLIATSATTFGFVTVSGDATLSGAGALTLVSLLTAGSAGSAAAVPTLTWDAKGRLTAVGSTAISIPHTQISDWGSYINQALLTTSSPTFASISLGRGSVSNYVGSPSYGAIYGASVTPSSTNYAIAWNVNGSDCEVNGTTSSSLAVNNVNIATATVSGLSVVGTISEGGTALSSKYLGINGTASNASALGGVAASSYLLSSTASTTYLPLSSKQVFSAYYGNSSTTSTWVKLGRYSGNNLSRFSLVITGKMGWNDKNSPGQIHLFGGTNYTGTAAPYLAAGGYYYEMLGSSTVAYNIVFVNAGLGNTNTFDLYMQTDAGNYLGFVIEATVCDGCTWTTNIAWNQNVPATDSTTTWIPRRVLLASDNYPSYNNFTSGIIAGNAGVNTWAGGSTYSWTGMNGYNSTTWSGFMQSTGETLIGALSGGAVSLAVAQTRLVSLTSTALTVTPTIVASAAAALAMTANGSGTYMRSALYSDASGVYLERGLASESSSAAPLPFYISKRGGGSPYPFLVNANDVTTNTMLYANGGLTTTTLTASGIITANGGMTTTALTASGMITTNGGLTVPDLTQLKIGANSYIESFDGAGHINFRGAGNYWQLTSNSLNANRNYTTTDLVIGNGLEVGGNTYISGVLSFGSLSQSYGVYNASSTEYYLISSSYGYAAVLGNSATPSSPSYVYIANGSVDGQTITVRNIRYNGGILAVNPYNSNLFVNAGTFISIPWGQSTTFVWKATAGKWY